MAAAPSFLFRLEEHLKARNAAGFVMVDVRMLQLTSKFSGWLQQRAYMWIVAMTRSRGCIGDQAQDSTDPISIPEWCVILGCKERHATDLFNEGTERGLFKRKEVRGRGFRYGVCADLAAVSDYVKPEPEAVDEVEEDLSEEPAVDEAGVVTIPPVVVQAKAKTKPIDLTTAVNSVRYHNQSDLGFEVGLTAAKGVLHVRVNIPKVLPKPGETKGEQKGINPCTPVHPPVRPALRQQLQETFSRYALGPIQDSLWDRICAELGATPDSWMSETVAQKLNAKRNYTLTPGLFVNFAKDAASRCSDWANSNRKKAAHASAHTQALADEFTASPFGQWLKAKGYGLAPSDGGEFCRLQDEFEAERKVAV